MSNNKAPTNEDRNWQSDLGRSSSFLGLGFQLAGSMLFYVLVGYLLDRWLDTEPWLLLVGAAVGMIAFFFLLFRLTKRLSEPRNRSPMEGTQESRAVE